MAQYDVDPDKKFDKEISNAVKKLNDLTVPLQLMTREWFKANRSIFDEGRKGPGKYKDLDPEYKKIKEQAIGSAYPILIGFLKSPGSPARKSGKLGKSMTDPSNPDSISTIVNKKALILGTKVTTAKGSPYGRFLHFGTRKMPARPFVLIGGEQVATSQVNKRRQNWVKMLNDFALQVSKGFTE